MFEAVVPQTFTESFSLPLSPEPELEIVLQTAVFNALQAIETTATNRAEKEANIARLFERHRFDTVNNPYGLTEPIFRLLRLGVEVGIK